ncbi:MAG: NAD(P)H-dependent oxidoreductase [bacterium]|nr:NAD(P)H-dependent oxidoreductase [bacterium]
MYIPIILGTAREGRRSELVAKYLLKELNNNYKELETEIIDVKDYIIGATDNTKKSKIAQSFSEKVSRADGLIIVSPEYNHGYPGELKLMIDMIYKEYAKKPVGICGVSVGPLGGGRAVEQLRQVVIELHMVPIREALYFPFVQNLFDDNGEIKESIYTDKVKIFLTELEWYAKTLKKAREENK